MNDIDVLQINYNTAIAKIKKLEKFYDDVQRSMNEHKEYKNLLEDINQATDEYATN